MCCEFEEMAIHLARKAKRTGGQNSPLVISLTKLIGRHEDGLAGLAERLQEAGLGAAMNSWVGRGENIPVRACALRTALGEVFYGKLVRRLDLDPVDAGEVLAEIFPLAVDRMTPEGRIETPAPRAGLQAFFARIVGAPV